MNIKKDYINKINALALIFISIYTISSVGFGIQPSHKLIYALTKLVTNLAFPLLLMTFGAIMLKKRENPLACVKKTYEILIPPFVLWNLILAVLIIYFNGFSFFTTTITEVNWFLWIVLSNVLVVPILSEFIHFGGDDGIKYLLGMFIISSILLSLSVQLDFSLYFIDIVFFAQPLSFMVLGYYLDNKEFKSSSNRIFIISLAILAIALFLRVLLLTSGIANWGAYFTQIFGTTLQISIDPFTIVEASAIFLMIKSLNESLKENSIISFYSERAFSFILALGIFTFILSKLALSLTWIKLTIIGSISFFIVIGIVFFLLEKIPFVKRFIA